MKRAKPNWSSGVMEYWVERAPGFRTITPSLHHSVSLS